MLTFCHNCFIMISSLYWLMFLYDTYTYIFFWAICRLYSLCPVTPKYSPKSRTLFYTITPQSSKSRTTLVPRCYLSHRYDLSLINSPNNVIYVHFFPGPWPNPKSVTACTFHTSLDSLNSLNFLKITHRISLVVQWIRTHLPMQGTWVWSLV